MTNKVTRKTNTEVTTQVAKVAKVADKALVVKVADVAIATQAKAKAAKIDYVPVSQFTALAELTAALAVRLDAVEKGQIGLVAQCETLERIIVGVQTAQAAITIVPQAAQADVVSQATAQAASNAKAQAATSPALGQLIENAIDDIIDGINSKRFNVNIRHLVDYDLRPFISRSTNQALKAAKDNGGPTLTALSALLVERFEQVTGNKAAEFSPLTKAQAQAARDAAE